MTLTIYPSVDGRRVALGVVAAAAHVASDDGVGGGTRGRALPPLAHHAHDPAVVRRRRAEQLERRHRRPRARLVAELDQAARHARANLARVIVVACAELYYSTWTGQILINTRPSSGERFAAF